MDVDAWAVIMLVVVDEDSDDVEEVEFIKEAAEPKDVVTAGKFVVVVGSFSGFIFSTRFLNK